MEYSEEAVGRLAIELGEALCQCGYGRQSPFDLDDAVGRLRELNEEIRLGPSTGAIVHAAVDRGIPFRRLTEGSMVQFGWGSGQRRIQAAETDFTGAVSESIAQDKELTRFLLSAAGIPCAREAGSRRQRCMGSSVRDRRSSRRQASGRQSGKGGRRKPGDTRAGRNGLRSGGRHQRDVLVERYIRGQDYRMLVDRRQARSCGTA